jgi:hypothetical protein
MWDDVLGAGNASGRKRNGRETDYVGFSIITRAFFMQFDFARDSTTLLKRLGRIAR